MTVDMNGENYCITTNSSPAINALGPSKESVSSIQSPLRLSPPSPDADDDPSGHPLPLIVDPQQTKEKEKNIENEEEKVGVVDAAGDKDLPSLTSNQDNNTNVEETTATSSTNLRRSNRNINAIRMKGTAQTFYRRLRLLFFMPSSHSGYQTIGGNRMELKRVHHDPPIYVIDDFLSKSELGKLAFCFVLFLAFLFSLPLLTSRTN